MSPEEADELLQLTERALLDAEQAYRLDPLDANQRRVMTAWSAVQKAREPTHRDETESTQLPATPDHPVV